MIAATAQALMIECAAQSGANSAAPMLKARTLLQHGAEPQLMERPCSFRVLYTLGDKEEDTK